MHDLATLKRMVGTSSDLTQEAREWSERDRDYYDSYQYTAAEAAIIRGRKQPLITINRIKRKIDAMVGIEQRGRVDPRALPREPGDENAADLATKALCFVEEKQRVDVKRSHAFENLLVEGYGGVEVCVEETRGALDPLVTRLRWEEIYFDPYSREKDFSDASYMGTQKWMALQQAITFANKYSQEAPQKLADMVSKNAASGGADTYEDRPQKGGGSFSWADKRLQRVRLAQMYYKDGDAWRLVIFTGSDILYDEPSPYLDENGKPDNAMILMSGYVDRENRRYGVVRDMISTQDEINKRRSKLLHQLNSRQTTGLKGAVDVARMKAELAKPDGHVEIDADIAEASAARGQKAFEILNNADQVAGQFSLLQEAKAEIDMLGPNASLLGQLQGQQSGRAIMAQQQAGLAELAPIYDSLRDWTERVYRAIWNRIRQYWTEPRWIRVTENEKAPEFIGVNQIVGYDMFGNPQMQNTVAELDVDIIIDQAPDYATLRAEQFEKLAAMMDKGIQIPPRLLIEASDLRDKQKLLEMLDGDPQQAQMAQQQAQQQAQIGQRMAVAEIGVKETQAMRNQAAAEKDMASIPKAQAEGAAASIQTAARMRLAQQAGL